MSSSKTPNYGSQDFIPLSLIGSGKSWDLFTARNRVDGRIVRIKSIRLEPGSDVGKILERVGTISGIEHRAITNIKHHWIGHQCKLTVALVLELEGPEARGLSPTFHPQPDMRKTQLFISVYTDLIKTDFFILASHFSKMSLAATQKNVMPHWPKSLTNAFTKFDKSFVFLVNSQVPKCWPKIPQMSA